MAVLKHSGEASNAEIHPLQLAGQNLSSKPPRVRVAMQLSVGSYHGFLELLQHKIT